MQEDPTNIPEGETPRSLLMYAFDTNVDACKPGDKVTITGQQQGVASLGLSDMCWLVCAASGWILLPDHVFDL